MISFLNICGMNTNIQVVWRIINLLINIIMIGVPIALIIYGMVDLGKAVIASKEDEVKKATKLLGKRFLYAIGVFAVVWFVVFMFSTLSDLAKGTNNLEFDSSSWQYCWKCNIRGKQNADKCKKVADDLKIPEDER